MCWSLRFGDNSPLYCCVFWQSKFLLGSKLVARIASGHVANPYNKICVHLVPSIWSHAWVLLIEAGWKTVLSVCFKGAFLLMHKCVSIGENQCVNLRSMYLVCLRLLSDYMYVLHSPLQGDTCSHRWDLRSVCLHLPSDDIYLYVYVPLSLRQGLATVCFHWRESIY